MALSESRRQGISLDFRNLLSLDGLGDPQQAPLPIDLVVRLQWAHDPCDVSLCIT